MVSTAGGLSLVKDFVQFRSDRGLTPTRLDRLHLSNQDHSGHGMQPDSFEKAAIRRRLFSEVLEWVLIPVRS